MCPWQHHGERTTRMVVGKRFYWPKMKYNVENFMRTYVKCQSMKSIYKKKYGLYRPQPILNEPWENVSMDFMNQLLKWNGMDAILMIVDQFSKLAKAAWSKIIITTFNLMKLLFDMWVKHHRMLQFIVSNKDAKFIMCSQKHLFQKAGTKLSFNTTFHP